MTLHQFYFDAIIIFRTNTDWRYGQAMFNHLVTVRPDLAEEIRGTDDDPFFCSSPKDPRFDRFVFYIENSWYCPTCPVESNAPPHAHGPICEIRRYWDKTTA